MSRKIQCITMALFLSAVLATSARAAPTRAPLSEPSPEVGFLSDAWQRLVSWLETRVALRGIHLTPQSTSQIDPNGGQH